MFARHQASQEEKGIKEEWNHFCTFKGHTLCCEQYTLELPIYPKTQKSIYSVGIFKLFL